MIDEVTELAEGVLIRWRLRATAACWWASDRFHDLGVTLSSGIPGVVTPLKMIRDQPIMWPYDGDQPLPEWEAELISHPSSPWRASQPLVTNRRDYDVDDGR